MKIPARVTATAIALSISVAGATSAAAAVAPAAATTAAVGSELGDYIRSLPALDEGDGGYRVLGLQMTLRTNGHREISGTGYFGPATRAAVRDVQLANGITPSGHVGVQTWTALTQQLRDRNCFRHSTIANPSLVPGDVLDEQARNALGAIGWATNVFDWTETIGSGGTWQNKTHYDSDWVGQIVAFQERFGITDSGIYGPGTTEAIRFLDSLSTKCVS